MIDSSLKESELRKNMVDVCRRMNRTGLNQGTAGNLSARLDSDRYLIPLSGIAYDSMAPEHLAVLWRDGRWSGPHRP